MAPLLVQVLTLPPTTALLMHSVLLIRPGDMDAFRLMADQTADALQASSDPADAASAEGLRKARGRR